MERYAALMTLCEEYNEQSIVYRLETNLHAFHCNLTRRTNHKQTQFNEAMHAPLYSKSEVPNLGTFDYPKGYIYCTAATTLPL